jgi:hypothetical protein
LAGLVVVSFRVDLNGVVVDPMQVFASQPPAGPEGRPRQFTTATDQAGIACVVDVYRRMRFPGATQPTNVVFPIRFD